MLMLFQLVITITILIILMLIFYLSVIYLPTKRLTEQYKSFSQVIVSFTQMSCYNVYVPLLLRMANDVKENPGPTIYVFDPSKTICAGVSQENTKQIIQNTCTGLKITAGHRTMTGQKCLLTGYFFTSPVILTGHICMPSGRILN